MVVVVANRPHALVAREALLGEAKTTVAEAALVVTALVVAALVARAWVLAALL